jgi:hypothetical protein
MELAEAQRAGQSGRLTMAGISYVFTISRVAEMLGEPTGSGRRSPQGSRAGRRGDNRLLTVRRQYNNLAELVQIHKADPELLPRRPKSRPSELAAVPTGC